MSKNTSPNLLRRKLLIGGIGAITLSACSQNQAAKALTCSVIPEETEGPYPADGSSHMGGGPGNPPPGNPPGNPPPGMDAGNRPPEPPQQLNASGETPNFLAQSDKIRRDITRSSTGTTAAGTPIHINLQLVNAGDGCTPLAGYAVYIWHCTDDGKYSMYSDGLKDEDFLRGVQASDSAGNVQFNSIFPGCYAGRWPHIHFEIYPSLEKATGAENKIKTSQLALPEAACREVYAQSGYDSSIANLNNISLDSDNVFGDGHELQMAEVSGNAQQGYSVHLKVGIAV